MKKTEECAYLLDSQLSKMLYLEYAREAPIFDYHSHVSAREIYEDSHYSNITQLWLYHDHYKWRIMRLCGIDERYITGDASDRDKFLKFAEVLPLCIGNPMYLWCHMELEKYFGYCGELNRESAPEVWDICERILTETSMGVRDIIRSSNVLFIGTTDDPCDSLEYHKKLSEESDLAFRVAPTFRPDAYLNIKNGNFREQIKRLSESSHIEICNLQSFKSALQERMNYFALCGCISADHGCNYIPRGEQDTCGADEVFKKALSGERLSEDEADGFLTYMLVFCAEQYGELDWVMQIHYNCLRNPNTLAYKKLGADSGFDCISRRDGSENLGVLMDKIRKVSSVKIILYSLEHSENQFIDTLVGSFACGEPFGRTAHGAAWWFNDTGMGIRQHLRSLASLGVLGNFVGMLTDSRSFLSYVRHDYFRRILCSVIAEFAERGECTSDIEALGAMVKNICYANSRKFFGMERDR